MVSGTFTVNGPSINSVVDAPDPIIIGQQISFSVNWTWPPGSIDIYICSTNSCSGLTGCAAVTYDSETNVSANPKTLKYLTESTGLKNYYVFVYDHADPTIASTDNGLTGTFDVNLTNLYFHFKDFRHMINPTDYTTMWSFYEQTGTTVYDKNKTTNNNLTLSGATWSAYGRFGGAIVLDGVNDYAYTSNVTPYATDTEGSISSWFYLNDTLGVDQTIISISDDNTNYQTYLSIYVDGVNEYVVAKLVVDGTTQWSIHGTASAGLVDYVSSFNSVIVTHDGVTPTLYINGVADSTATVTTDTTKWLNDIVTTATYKASIICLGTFSNNSSRQFYLGGKMDDTRIYNYGLSSSEVADVYSIRSYVTGTNCAIASREKDMNKIYNRVQVLGNNTVASDIKEDTSSQLIYGIRELTYTDRSILNNSDANEVAQRYLDRYAYPIEHITIIVVERNFNEVIGDIIKLTDINSGLSASEYRLVKISRKYGREGDKLTYDLESI
jgi:hypothetical protein